jgi:hypothetical protein
MVWSQYVYEAATGLDADISDDDEFNENTPLNIEDWEVEYSEELHMMWDTLRTLMYDAHIEHNGKFVDFVEFCYTEHNPYHEYESHDEHLLHIWKSLRRIINQNELHEEMMRGATFFHFAEFVKNYVYVY